MPIIRTVDLSARSRLQKPRPDSLAPYREAVDRLAGPGVIELTPDEGETLRKLKLLVSRAAREAGKAVVYGETPEGTLLVWLKASRRQPRRTQPE